jgi:acetyl esterase/lipase
MRSLRTFASILLVAAAPSLLQAEARIESNVVYGMYSGSALLLDVHYPAAPNGYGIVFVPGNAWHEPLSFDAEPLKGAISDRAFMGADALLENGYTLFSINYRSAPGFRYPAAVEDAQRAVRYVRYHAALYGIDPNRIGVIGHSSGGHLASMLGVLDGDGDPEDLNPINQESSNVQAVVALAGAGDLTAFATGTDGDRTAVSSFIGTYLAFFRTPESQRQELSLYAAASPSSYVSPDDPPFLLVHGDKDTVVPFSQSELFHQKLADGGVTVELIRIPSGDHFLASSEFDVAVPDYMSAMVEWFDRFLVNQR